MWGLQEFKDIIHTIDLNYLKKKYINPIKLILFR